MEYQVTAKDSINPEKLIQELAARMNAKNIEWDNSTVWTEALKQSLGGLLENQDKHVTDVLYSDSAKDKHEFLLDVVVWNRSGGERVILAVESEWSQKLSDIEADFWKLLVVKSPVKLMIFACNRRPRKFSQEAIWTRLSSCLLLYRDHIAGERYVFMNYAPPPGRKAWWIEIPNSGKLQMVPEPCWVDFD